jgi:hypothetical protein
LFRIVEIDAWEAFWGQFLSCHVLGEVWLVFFVVKIVVFVLCEETK